MMSAVSFLLALLVIVGTALPLVRSGRWWIRIFDFPRLQLAVLGILVVLYQGMFGLATRSAWIATAMVMVAVGYQAWCILRYTPFFSKQVQTTHLPESGNELTVLVSNVLMSNRQPEKLLRAIKREQPDVIFTVEIEKWWGKALEPLEQNYPHVIRQVQENGYGMILFSRLPLEDAEVRFLVEDDVPSVFCRVVLPGGRRVRLYGLHPRPPAPQENDSSLERDAELILVGREISDNPEPAVVIGDLNDVAWSDTTRLFQRVGRMLDPRVGRGFKSTFHADIPFLRFPLDHVFVTRDFGLRSMKVLENVGSDHFPMLARVACQPVQNQAGTEPVEIADQEDEQEADRILEQQAVHHEQQAAQRRQASLGGAFASLSLKNPEAGAAEVVLDHPTRRTRASGKLPL